MSAEREMADGLSACVVGVAVAALLAVGRKARRERRRERRARETERGCEFEARRRMKGYSNPQNTIDAQTAAIKHHIEHIS